MKPQIKKRLANSTGSIFLSSLIITFAVIVLIYGAAESSRQRHVEGKTGTTLFQEMSLQTVNGDTFTSEDLKNSKVTMLNIWSTTCPACIDEMPVLEKISQSCDPQEIQFVGLCADTADNDGIIDANLAECKSIIEQTGLTYTQVIPDPSFLSYINSYVVGYPTTLFLNSEGKLIDESIGSHNEETWIKVINAALAKAKEN